MNPTPGAAAAGTITIGDDLEVNRMGFGAMRLTGPGIWGEPKDPQRRAACCSGRWSSASISSIRRTPTARRSTSGSSPQRCIRTREAW